MAYKNFRLNIIFRIILLAVSVSAFVYACLETSWIAFTFLLGAGIVGLTIEMIRYVEKTNRDLSHFLFSIRHHDFTKTFVSGGRGKSYLKLKFAFNNVIQEFRDLSAEKEAHHLYLQTVVEHVGTALLCLDKVGNVVLMNSAAKALLKKPYLPNINYLEKTDAQLYETVRRLKSGENRLVRVMLDHEMLHLSVQVKEFSLQDQYYKLVNLQNIRNELEEQELIAWQKLIRVLRHEIMNSITPVISLTDVIIQMLEDEVGEIRDLSQFDDEDLQDVRDGLKTIERRSKGLLEFVHTYRNLTKIPPPKFEITNLEELFGRLRILLKPEFAHKNIKFEVHLENPNLTLKADPALLEQVLINLLINARQAVETKGTTEGRIKLSATKSSSGSISIKVADNGNGITKEAQDNIFIPFFTTKKNGSGIGLSLSRQIMRLHKGTISLASQEGEGTVVTLDF